MADTTRRRLRLWIFLVLFSMKISAVQADGGASFGLHFTYILFILFVVGIVSFHCWLKRRELEIQAKRREDKDVECQMNQNVVKVQEWYNDVVDWWPISTMQYLSMKLNNETPIQIAVSTN